MTQTNKLINVDIANNIQKTIREKKGEKIKYEMEFKNKFTDREFKIDLFSISESELKKTIKNNYFNNIVLSCFKIIKGAKIKIELNV